MAFPKNTYTTPLSTKRLLLVPLTLADQNEIFELQSDEQILKYIDRKKMTSIDEAIAFINKITSGIEDKKWCYWKIRTKASNDLIGTICLWMFSEDGKTCDIGYDLRTNYQGNGFMSEAAEEVVKFGLEQLSLTRIDAYTHGENLASIKLVKRLGFEFRKQDGENVVYSAS